MPYATPPSLPARLDPPRNDDDDPPRNDELRLPVNRVLLPLPREENEPLRDMLGIQASPEVNVKVRVRVYREMGKDNQIVMIDKISQIRRVAPGFLFLLWFSNF